MTDSCDVAIIGAGLVGASLALALADAGLSVTLIEPHPPRAPAPEWDSRVYAISPGSAAFLEALGAWQGVDGARVARVQTMRVYGDAPSSQLDFSAYEAGVGELALIAENGRVQAALWQCLERSKQVRLMCPAQCEALRQHPDHTEIAIAIAGGDATLHTRLVVGADGAQSWVRGQARIRVIAHDYQQSAVVANFQCALPHRDTAFQWFRADGVLALLPLPGQRVSMVWSTSDDHAQSLLALAAGELAQCVFEASGGAAGALEVITPAAAFPLKLQRVAHCVAPRLALVGDAAHNVHPLAGQGVNLGFRDARELAAVLCGRGARHDCGDYALLRRYERARKEDVLSMQLATDGLQKLFAADAVWLSRTRNLGMRAVQSLPLLKNRLVKHALA